MIFFYLFTVGFVKIIPPSLFKCKKYSSPKGFNANFTIFQNIEIISKNLTVNHVLLFICLR